MLDTFLHFYLLSVESNRSDGLTLSMIAPEFRWRIKTFFGNLYSVISRTILKATKDVSFNLIYFVYLLLHFRFIKYFNSIPAVVAVQEFVHF